MKKITLILGLCSFFVIYISSCNRNNVGISFDKYFKNVSQATLHLSYWHSTEKDSISLGKRIPYSIIINAFDSVILFQSEFYKQFPLKDNDYYAVGKIKISDDVDGFIIRTLTISMLNQNIELCIYDHSKKHFIKGIELSELTGGESETQQTDCWITSLNSDNHPDLVFRNHLSYQQKDSIIEKDTLYTKVWENATKSFINYIPENGNLYKSKFSIAF